MSRFFRPFNPANKIEVDLLVEAFRNMKAGEMIPYADLNTLIKGDVQKARRHILTRAMALALRERIALAAVWNQGIKCLEDSERATVGGTYRQRIRRVARKGAAVLGSVKDFMALKPQEKLTHNVNLAVMAAVERTANQETIKRLEKRIAPESINERGAVAQLAIEAAGNIAPPPREEKRRPEQSEREQSAARVLAGVAGH